MDTVVQQSIYADDASVLQQNVQIIYELEQKTSKTLKTSDIYAINHAGGKAVTVSDDTLVILQRSIDVANETKGAFNPALGNIMEAWNFKAENPSVPPAEQITQLLSTSDYHKITIRGKDVSSGGTSIDLGGAVKGYALQKVAENLKTNQISSALINMGGAIYALGEKPDGKPYVIGLRDPLSTVSGYFGTIVLDDEFVSTSGTYERGFTVDDTYYHHLIDPATGSPSTKGLYSVTIVGTDGMLTDLYSTALFVMGPKEGLEYANQHGIDALFYTNTKEILMTDGFAEKYSFEKISGVLGNA